MGWRVVEMKGYFRLGACAETEMTKTSHPWEDVKVQRSGKREQQVQRSSGRNLLCTFAEMSKVDGVL